LGCKPLFRFNFRFSALQSPNCHILLQWISNYFSMRGVCWTVPSFSLWARWGSFRLSNHSTHSFLFLGNGRASDRYFSGQVLLNALLGKTPMKILRESSYLRVKVHPIFLLLKIKSQLMIIFPLLVQIIFLIIHSLIENSNQQVNLLRILSVKCQIMDLNSELFRFFHFMVELQ
jgi:hypothetical protein